MTERQLKRATLEKRLERLEERLYQEKLRLHKVIDGFGWGRGMRCTKCTPSFRRQTELEEKIKEVKRLLALNNS